MQTQTVAATIARLLVASRNCEASGNAEWLTKHRDRIEQIVDDLLPSGSGWDQGTKLDEGSSTENKLVFVGSYHHMDEGGGYDGWTDHKITVTPTFAGVSVSISGRNRNGIKEYLSDLFYDHCSQLIVQNESGRYVGTCLTQTN